MLETPVQEEQAIPRASRLDRLYVEHYPASIRLAYLLTGRREDAEDLVQDAFVRLASSYRHLRDAEAFPAYLRRTIVNLHTSRLRRLRVERGAIREVTDAGPASIPDFAGRDQLWQAVLELPARQRVAVVLRYYEDLSERDSAEILRCSIAALKSLVTRALSTLRQRTERDVR